MKQFYIQTNSGQEGPFSIEELAQRNISLDTPVWREGMADWVAASMVSELRGKISYTITPPPYGVTPPKFNPIVDDTPVEKSAYKRSIYQLVGIATIVILGFIYFTKQSDASPSPEYPDARTKEVDSSGYDPAEEERKRINERITAKNMAYRNNWDKYIACGNGDYKASSLGGIYDLEVVVQNKTEYSLEEVNVTVSYIKDNGSVYKTEEVTIYNVPAKGKASMPAPDSSRGTSVSMDITSITSKKMHFHYNAVLDVEGREDPYFARY